MNLSSIANGFFGVLLCSLPALAQNSPIVPDLDRDGIPDTAVISQSTDHWRLDIWLSTRGSPIPRVPDIVLTEAFVGQVEAFRQIGAASDTDADGVLEISTLSTVIDSETNRHVSVLSIYSSADGRPMMTFFGAGAETLFLVVEGQAIGSPVNDLLLTIPQTIDTRPEFSVSRLFQPGSGSYGTDGSTDDSSSSGPGSWVDKGIQVPRITWALREWDPWSWSWNLGRFWALSDIAKTEADKRFPNDSGKCNALRHALWQFLLACQFGADRAKTIGDIHEDVSTDP